MAAAAGKDVGKIRNRVFFEGIVGKTYRDGQNFDDAPGRHERFRKDGRTIAGHRNFRRKTTASRKQGRQYHKHCQKRSDQF
ncbi:MAG TPA: hypothetical protein DEP00_06490 [Lachnospiraceae bacterium]|nr:hypothetical protein [Lachnospiraceae bacterium]